MIATPPQPSASSELESVFQQMEQTGERMAARIRFGVALIVLIISFFFHQTGIAPEMPLFFWVTTLFWLSQTLLAHWRLLRRKTARERIWISIPADILYLLAVSVLFAAPPFDPAALFRTIPTGFALLCVLAGLRFRIWPCLAASGLTAVALTGLAVTAYAHRIFLPPIQEILVLLLLPGTCGLLTALMVRQVRHLVIRAEIALHAHPLTGLPGSKPIACRIDAAIRKGEDLVAVYADLDHFKAYNDRYGFTAGDRMLRFTAQTLSEILTKTAPGRHFLGHLGGDDFVFLLPRSKAQSTGEQIAAAFEKGLDGFYDATDMARGGFSVTDRQGAACHIPLVGLSMAGMALRSRPVSGVAEVVAICSEVRAAAKASRGSLLLLDRRADHQDGAETHPGCPPAVEYAIAVSP